MFSEVPCKWLSGLVYSGVPRRDEHGMEMKLCWRTPHDRPFHFPLCPLFTAGSLIRSDGRSAHWISFTLAAICIVYALYQRGRAVNYLPSIRFQSRSLSALVAALLERGNRGRSVHHHDSHTDAHPLLARSLLTPVVVFLNRAQQ